MINYTWQINALEYAPELDGLPKVITQVYWTYIATEDDIVQSIYGSQPVELDDLEHFIPYQDVTEDIVISWLEQDLDVPAMQASLAVMIENVKNPPTVIDNNPFNN